MEYTYKKVKGADTSTLWDVPQWFRCTAVQLEEQAREPGPVLSLSFTKKKKKPLKLILKEVQGTTSKPAIWNHEFFKTYG